VLVQTNAQEVGPPHKMMQVSISKGCQQIESCCRVSSVVVDPLTLLMRVCHVIELDCSCGIGFMP